MKRFKILRMAVMVIAVIWLGLFATMANAENVPPTKNIFAQSPLIHVLGPSPALTPSADRSAVDSSVLESCAVFKDTDGTYYWYYHAQSKDKKRWPHGYRICVATAKSPLGPWKKYEKNPVLDLGKKGGPDSWMTACAVVMKEGAYDIRSKDAKYYMWYIGDGLCLATAKSPLGPWKRYKDNPIMDDAGYLGAVIRKDGKFYMFYQHPVSVEDQGPYAIATADKPEGPWTKYKGNPVMTPGDWGAWDDGGFSEAGISYNEGVYHCVFGGTKAPKVESLGYAYSFDGIQWHKYEANPVVPLSRVPDASGFAEVHCFVEGPYIYVFHTLRYFTGEGTARGLGSFPDWKTEDLGVQVLTIDPHFKLSFQILQNASLGPQKSSRIQECLPIGLEAASTLALAIECTYDADAKAGLRLHVRASDDGVHCDTDDLETIDLPFRAGQTVRKTVVLNAKTKFARVIVENLDGSREAKSVHVTATVGN